MSGAHPDFDEDRGLGALPRGGARLRCHVFEKFARSAIQMDPVGGLGTGDVAAAIRAHTGPGPDLFVP